MSLSFPCILLSDGPSIKFAAGDDVVEGLLQKGRKVTDCDDGVLFYVHESNHVNVTFRPDCPQMHAVLLGGVYPFLCTLDNINELKRLLPLPQEKEACTKES